MKQQVTVKSTQTDKPLNDGLATIFFLLGAPHVYNVLRSRPNQTQASRKTGGWLDLSFTASAVAIAIFGLVEMLHYSPAAIF